MTSMHSVTCAALFLGAFAASPAVAYHRQAAPVTVEVVDERGQSFEEFPLSNSGRDTYRAWLKARRGAAYRIRVRNQSGERVGVVIAVDGRNIISGQRSNLTPRESMYVLGPWESGDYRGWRTNLREVHEFYFTEWPDAYAESFGDRSAQGVIAMAVYRDRDWQARLEQERREQQLRDQELRRRQSERYSGGAAAPEAAADAAASRNAPAPGRANEKAEASAAPPGTGFGERRYDPAQRVEFRAERLPVSRSFLKYEWAETLCRKGISCDGQHEPKRHNRFWPDDTYGFAPYPTQRGE
jgi:hypothetical protein